MAKGSDGLEFGRWNPFSFGGGDAVEMKAVLVREVGAFELTEVAMPEPCEDELVIRVEVTGLCRTDLKIIRVGHRDLVLPRIPGEEVVGRVWKVGERVSDFREEDRVYLYPGLWCGECPACRSGAENLCRGMRIMGFHRDGGFAQYVTVPAKSALHVPEGLSAERAVFAEPLSCCLNALELARLSPGETLGIWGAGPAGTLLQRAARALGADPLSIEPDPRRRALIDGVASGRGRQFDVCIVAVGSRAAYEEALGGLCPRGRLVIFSGLHPSEERLPVSFNELHYFEQTLVGAYGCSYRHSVRALELIGSGAVSVEDMISHRLPLDELETALGIVERREGMKVLLIP